MPLRQARGNITEVNDTDDTLMEQYFCDIHNVPSFLFARREVRLG